MSHEHLFLTFSILSGIAASLLSVVFIFSSTDDENSLFPSTSHMDENSRLTKWILGDYDGALADRDSRVTYSFQEQTPLIWDELDDGCDNDQEKLQLMMGGKSGERSLRSTDNKLMGNKMESEDDDSEFEFDDTDSSTKFKVLWRRTSFTKEMDIIN